MTSIALVVEWRYNPEHVRNCRACGFVRMHDRMTGDIVLCGDPGFKLEWSDDVGDSATIEKDYNVFWWKPGPLPRWFPWQPMPIWRHHA